MSPEAAMQWLDFINCLLIAIVVTIVYCVVLVVHRLRKINKDLERREQEFWNSPWFQEQLKKIQKKE